MANTKHKKDARRAAAAAHSKANAEASKAAREARIKAAEDAAGQPDTTDKTAKWMGALCYLSVLIIIPACSRWRKDDFVRFHLNQGLIVLAAATICGALSMVPGLNELGVSLTLLVDVLSLVGLVYALRSRKAPLPLFGQLMRSFHPF